MTEQEAVMAECLLDAACKTGTDSAACQFCGKVWGEPAGEDEALDESVSIGYLAGRQVVWNCRCKEVMAYARFVLSHRHALADALKAFAKRESDDAERLRKAIG